MPHLSGTIHGRSYSVACEEGQREHLGRLADHLKDKVEGLAESLGQIGDARLMLMAGLLISDELSDACEELEVARGAEDKVATQNVQDQADRMTGKLEKLAQRAEAIAARLEAP